jgi:hypothetical protein
MGTAYRRVGYLSGLTTTVITANDAVHYDAYGAVLGAGDRVHLFYTGRTPAGATDLRHRTLLSNNTLTTEQVIVSSGNVQNSPYPVGVPHFDGTTVMIPYVNASGVLMVAYATSADSPTWATSTVSDTGNGPQTTSANPGAVAHSGTAWHIAWPDNAQTAVLKDTSSTGATWGTDSTVVSGIGPINGVNAVATSSGLYVLYDNNGTVTLDYPSTGPTPVTLTRTAPQSAAVRTINHTRTATQAANVAALTTLTRTATQSAAVRAVDHTRIASQVANVALQATSGQRTTTQAGAVRVADHARTASQTAAIGVAVEIEPVTAIYGQGVYGRSIYGYVFGSQPQTHTRIANQSAAVGVLVSGQRTATQSASVRTETARTAPQEASVGVIVEGQRSAIQQAAIRTVDNTRTSAQSASVALQAVTLTRTASQAATVSVVPLPTSGFGIDPFGTSPFGGIAVGSRSATQAAAIRVTSLVRTASQSATVNVIVAGARTAVQAAAVRISNLARTAAQAAAVRTANHPRTSTQNAAIRTSQARTASQAASIQTASTRTANQQASVRTVAIITAPQSATISVAGLTRTATQSAAVGVAILDQTRTASQAAFIVERATVYHPWPKRVIASIVPDGPAISATVHEGPRIIPSIPNEAPATLASAVPIPSATSGEVHDLPSGAITTIAGPRGTATTVDDAPAVAVTLIHPED